MEKIFYVKSHTKLLLIKLRRLRWRLLWKPSYTVFLKRGCCCGRCCVWYLIGIQSTRLFFNTCHRTLDLNFTHSECAWEGMKLIAYQRFLIYFCYYVYVLLHFLVLFIGLIVLFNQLLGFFFFFLYNTFSKNKSISVK